MTTLDSTTFPSSSPLPPIRGPILPDTGRDKDVNSLASRPTTTNPDPTSSDDPSFSSKLTNVEAQRIMSVLQDMQRKVQLIGLLPDHMDRRVSSVFGGETVTVITEYRQLEQKYKQLIEARQNHDKGTPMPESFTSDLKETSRALRAATRTLARHFASNPTALSKLRYLKSTKPPVIGYLESLIQEVKMLTYERLRITVEEEKAKQDQLSGIIAKEQKTSNEVRVLKEELEKAKKERMSEINKKNEAIRRLKDELRDIKHQAEETTKRLEARSKQKEDSDLQQFRDREHSLRTEILQLTTKLSETTKRNREEEAQLRKRKFKIEGEVENWIHKYDQDMDEKQTELEDITAIYLEEKAQLDELTARHAELQKEYEKIMEERRVQSEIKKEKEKEHQRLWNAAMRIQAIFRGFRVRRDIAKGKKEKAAKGKGGGKAKSAKGKAKKK
ncbi:hypothetical protein HK097_006723 [Rhizophlyctis rosea]|uniref:Dynein regulatory complex protein 10 n=1 Tax=Rhizophlyctis rosea TaxID=64517 RepID=A0AAD5SCF7_9FUNG|nr:hypothetical protein HK097_006723 [Rhizophlyctis rosea]